MAVPVLDKAKQTRVRASKKALETVLDALASKGLAVEKLCVAGAQVEIHIGHVDGSDDEDDAGGLKRI